MSEHDDANDILMGGSAPTGFKFSTVGDTAAGTIVRAIPRQQTDFKTKDPLFWPDGNKKMQVGLVIDPINGGDQCTVWVKGQMMAAVREAVRMSGADKIDTGGTIGVRFDHEEPSQSGGDPQKIYIAQYKPPAPSMAAANDMLGTAPAPQTQPAAAPVAPQQSAAPVSAGII